MDDEKLFDEWKGQGVSPRDAKRARKMVWRTRFSIAFSVLRTLFILLLIYCIYITAVSFFYDDSDENKLNRYLTTLVEMHHSGMQVEKTGFVHVDISPLLTQSTTRKLFQRVGKWNVVIGEVNAKKELFGRFQVRLDLDGKYLNQTPRYGYVVPPDLLGKGETVLGSKSRKGSAWKRLDKIGDGYVAQMSFSTKRGMTPEGLQQLLADYNLTLLQMPVYAGEVTAVEGISTVRTSGGKVFVPHLTLHPKTDYSEKNRLSSWQIGFNNKESVTKAVDSFMQDLNWLIQNGDYAWEKIDKKRLAYLQKHGVKVYGAVVTGPVSELKKLKSEKALYEFELGRVELWNW
ncbi:MAG TPA: anti sigma factor C-terminal domain-containing protein [Bacillales bacterium]|nr:anti sigma factor C-terminal domain-containing protein [Bacillales bacterium]